MTFEIDNDFVCLVNNPRINVDSEELKDLEHLIDKKLRINEIVYELRQSGILICPSDEDITYSGFQLKVYILFRIRKH